MPNTTPTDAARDCQKELHAWGRAHKIALYPNKESMHVLSHRCPDGGAFKILGVVFDCRLTMQITVAKWFQNYGGECDLSTLRARPHHDVAGMVQLYKTPVLSYIENRTATFHHTCDFHLAAPRAMQTRFLEDIGLDPLVALRRFYVD